MQLANGNVAIQRSVLPEDALQATDATVQRMMEVAEGAYGMRSPKIRALAINIVRKAGVKEKDYYGEIIAIHEWVKRNIRYVKDPVNQETLSHPEETAFNSRAGDCDDMTILEIALLGSIGIKAWPVVMGVRPGIPSHVYLRAQVPPGKHRNAGKVINLDPIMKQWRAGQAAPRSKVKIEHDYRDGNYANGIQRQRSNQMDGLNDDLGSAFSMLPGMGELGEYVTSDSYLDDEHSHAQELLKPDLAQSTGSVANTAKVGMAMEGVDGIFGGFGAQEVVEDVGEATPMQDRDSLYQLGPKGPMTARAAQQARKAIPKGPGFKPQNVDAKNYEAPTLTKALAQSRGKGTAQVRSCKTIVNVQSNNGPAATTPKTAREEASEIDGLAGEIRTMASSFLPGLGMMGEDEREEVAEKSALLAWWTGLKAKMASARAAWAEEKARQARVSRANLVAEKQQAEAAQERSNAQNALRCAEEAGKVTQAMARQDPAMAQVIAETTTVLDQKGEEAAQVDGLLGLSADDLAQAAGNFGRRLQVGQGRRAVPVQSERRSTELSMPQRELVALRKQRNIIDQKIARLLQIVRKGRPAVRRAMRRAGGPRIHAPVTPTAVRVPEQRGRRSMMRGVRGRYLPTPVETPAAVSGLGEGFSLTSPLVLGAAGLGLWLFMKRKK